MASDYQAKSVVETEQEMQRLIALQKSFVDFDVTYVCVQAGDLRSQICRTLTNLMDHNRTQEYPLKEEVHPTTWQSHPRSTSR